MFSNELRKVRRKKNKDVLERAKVSEKKKTSRKGK